MYIDCYYRPVKRPAPSRRDKVEKEQKAQRPIVPMVDYNAEVRAAVTKSASRVNGPQHLDDHERKVWTVFFSMYKKFGKGCSSYWFKVQLCKMDAFLQEHSNEAALDRLRGWMEALGIVLEDCSAICQAPPHLQMTFEITPQPTVHRSADELSLEAKTKSIPLVYVNQQGMVECNAAFEQVFGRDGLSMNKMLANAGGGFLPFSGDVMASILAREADLLTYVQIVALSFDSLGKPESFPASRSFPTSHVFRVIRADGNEAWAVIKCVHWQSLSINKEFTSTFLASFDLSAPEVQQPAASKPLTVLEDEKIDESLPYISSKDLVGDDEGWLENLLTWVDEDTDAAVTAAVAAAAATAAPHGAQHDDKNKPVFDLEMLDLPLADETFNGLGV